jgi:hypothetical protein
MWRNASTTIEPAELVHDVGAKFKVISHGEIEVTRRAARFLCCQRTCRSFANDSQSRVRGVDQFDVDLTGSTTGRNT